MLRKRLGSTEVMTKLREAGELAGKGKTQQEIAQTLGVSVMTLHRWRKREGAQIAPLQDMEGCSRDQAPTGLYTHRDARESLISKLELENSRLRRLVADLLLEKMELEDRLFEKRPITPPL